MSNSNPADEYERVAAQMVKLGKPTVFHGSGEMASDYADRVGALMAKLGTPRVAVYGGGETVPLEEAPVGKTGVHFEMRPEILTPEEISRLDKSEEVVGYLSLAFEREQAAFHALHRAPPRPTLSGLSDLADWFGLGLRKRLKAMLGDYDAEVRRLYEDRRYGAARWSAWLARACFFWYLLRGPLDAIISALIRAMRGGA